MEDNTPAKFAFLASFILPNGILDWFYFVEADEEPVEKKDCIYKSTLHIYLDEKDNRTNEHLLLKPNGLTEPTVIKDFPVRNRSKYPIKDDLYFWFQVGGNLFKLAKVGSS